MANSPITRPITSFTVPWGLLRLLVNAAPENWAEISYKAATLGSTIEHTLLAVDKEGVTYRLRAVDYLSTVVEDLRRAEYTRENGPWFGISVILKSDGAKVMTRRYGAAPVWEQQVPEQAYAEDLELFPREDAAIPAWLREKAGLPPAEVAAEAVEGAEAAGSAESATAAAGSAQ